MAYSNEQIQQAYQESLAQGFTPEQVQQGALANFGISAEQLNAALNAPSAAPAQAGPATPTPVSAAESPYQAPQIQQAYQEALAQGYTPEQIQQGAQQNFGISASQLQNALAPAATSAQIVNQPPANPYAFYDQPVKTDYGYRLNDLYGLSVHDDGSRIQGLIRFDPTTGQRQTTDAFYAGDILRGLQQQGLGLEALQGLNRAIDQTGLAYRPNQQYGAQGSNHGIDFDALARGELGTAYDWTSDVNVGAKGPSALAQLQRDQQIAQQFGLRGANTGLVGRTDIPQFDTRALGNQPGGISTLNYSQLGVPREAYVGQLGGGLSNINSAWQGAEGLTTYGQPAALPSYMRNNNAGFVAPTASAQLEKRQGEVATATPAVGAPSTAGQPARPGQQFGLDVDSYIQLLLGMGGDITPENLMTHRDQLLPALQAAQDRQRNINYNYGYLTDGPDASLLTDTFSGTAPTRLGEVAGLTPQEVAYAERLLSGNYAEPFWTGEATRSAGNRATGVSTSAVTALANAGFSFSDINNILGAAQNAGLTPAGSETAADALRREAAARFIETTGLRPDDGGGFGTFIKDAFKSPVGAAILAGLTGGLGGLGAIGSGLTGGALTGAGASALGGATLAGARGVLSGASGSDILRQAGLAAATAGLGSAYGGDVLNAVKGAVPETIRNALGGVGDFLSGSGGEGNAFAGTFGPNDITPGSFAEVPTGTFPTFNDFGQGTQLGSGLSDLGLGDITSFPGSSLSGGLSSLSPFVTGGASLGATPVGPTAPVDLSRVPITQAEMQEVLSSDAAENFRVDRFREYAGQGLPEYEALRAALDDTRAAALSGFFSGVSVPTDNPFSGAISAAISQGASGPGAGSLTSGPITADTIRPGTGERPVAEVTPARDNTPFIPSVSGSGGAGGFSQVGVSAPVDGGTVPAGGVGAGAGDVLAGVGAGALAPIADQGEISRPPVTEAQGGSGANLSLPDILRLLGLGSTLLGALQGVNRPSAPTGGIATLQRGPSRYGQVRKAGTASGPGYVPTDYYVRDRIVQ